MKTLRQTVLITGGSIGIGYELAKLFAREGHSLILVARNREKLEAAASELRRQFGVTVKVMPKDLARPLAASEIFEELQREKITIDILVNNAGVGDYGPFADADTAKTMDMIQINLTSLVSLTKLFLRQVPVAGGRIMNVASTAAFQPGPFMATYYATKAFVLHFSEAISEELKARKIFVTVLCPGPTATDFQGRSNIVGVRLLKLSMMSASAVARIGYRGFWQGKAVVITGFGNQVVAFLIRLSPRFLILKIVHFIQQKTKRFALKK